MFTQGIPNNRGIQGTPIARSRKCSRPMAGEDEDLPGGYFPTPNRLFSEGCRRSVALAVYAALAATPAIWTARGDLKPFEVRASRADLADATGATAKQVRGALAWLIRAGFLIRLDTEGTATAAFEVVRGAKISPTGTTGYGEVGPRWPEKGQAKGQDGAKPNGKGDNGLRSFPQPGRAKMGAKVLKDVKDVYHTTHPHARGGVVDLWSEAWDGNPPSEPKATRNPDAYRRTVLERAMAGETPEDVRRMFASWVAGRDPDWVNRRGDTVADFAAGAGHWIECRNLERKHRQRTEAPKGGTA